MRLLIVGLVFLISIGVGGANVSFAQETPLTPIQVDDILEDIRKGTPVDYTGVEVHCGEGEVLDFTQLAEPGSTEVIISVPIKIIDSVIDCPVTTLSEDVTVHFQSTVNFTTTNFTWNVYFVNATFDDLVNFLFTEFNQEAHFGSSIFNGQASFERAHFAGDFGFDDTQFQREVTFGGSRFDSPGVFLETTFSEGIGFEDATFRGYIIFQDIDATIEDGEIDFSGTHFYSDVRIEGITFGAPVSFQNVTGEGRVSFQGSTFGTLDLTGIALDQDESLNLFDTEYDDLIIGYDFNFAWVKVGDQTDAVDVFAKMEADFREQGRRPLANEAFYHKRIAECALSPRGSSGFFDCALGYPFGYLFRPARAFIWSLASIIVFGLLLAIFKTKLKQPSPEDQPAKGLAWYFRIRYGLALSFAIFTSVRSIPPWETAHETPKVRSIIVRDVITFLVFVEWIWGTYLMAGLVITLANTLQVFEQLLDYLP